jgi:peptide/nickel transport system substrate-binding protein
MHSLSKIKPKSFQLSGLGAALALLLVVACGTAATATPGPTQATQPAATTATLSVVPTATPISALGPTSTAGTVNPGKLTWMTAGWGSERFTFNFGVGGGNNYARILHGWLIATNEKAELLPGIATKWEISSDGKTWTFTIREGARFHDGQAITAEDVWWTFMHYWGKDASGSAVERATSSATQGVARVTEKIELTAPNQVSWTRTSPDAGFPGTSTSEAGPQWFGVLPKRPKVHDSDQEAAYDKNPIGAGSGKLVKHVPADSMTFERFDDFYYQPKNGLPEDRRLKFKTLVLRLIPEEATRVAAIRAGEADIGPASLATKNQVEAGGGRLVFGPEGVYVAVSFRGCWRPEYPCHDKRVRQALDLAIDKTVIRDRLFGGPEVFQDKGWGFVTPSSIGYSPDLDPRPQDVAKARQLLAEAGYPGGKNFGTLVVNTWVSTAMPFLPESAQLAAEYWRRELGLDVEVKVGDEAALKKATLTSELYGQVLWADNEARLEPASGYDTYAKRFDDPARLHEDPTLLELVNQTLAVIDTAQRAEAFNKLHMRAREETYQPGIGYVNIPWAVGPRVAVWQPRPLAFYPNNLHGIILK